MANPQQSFTAVTLTPGTLLHGRRTAVSQTTLLYQLDVLKKTGRYNAFKLEWHPSYSDPPLVWRIPNHLFWDSDIGKWIEGACYFLVSAPKSVERSTIQSAVDELIDMIAKAQQPDGYLNIHYTVVAPGLRFTNIRDMHELYNCGHLIEAALAHDSLVGPKTSLLLTTMLKYVDLLCACFGPAPDQMHGYPGHPEIELALLRLYKRTGSSKHLALASYFITERGNPTGSLGQHYYITEASRRGEDPYSAPSYMTGPTAFWYHQAHLPLTKQTEIKGHSVRAMYLLTAAADLCLLQPQTFTADLLPAVRALWNDMVTSKMYLTGGIGAIEQWEGFGVRYFLPQSTDEGGCYAETCASIGIMMLAERLLQLDLDGSVADVMELALYNNVLGGMSADGRRFTYVNQLASSEGKLALRNEWFTCACCPPNVLRCLAMLGGYIFSFQELNRAGSQANGTQGGLAHTNGNLTTGEEVPVEEEEATINVHLFISSTGHWTTSSGTEITLSQQSNYPWSGDINFSLETTSKKVALNIRIPAWAKHGWSLSPPPLTTSTPSNGYLHLPSHYLQQHRTFTLSLPLRPRLIAPHPLSPSSHTVTLARGPIVYCVEDADNAPLGVPTLDHFRGLHLDARTCLGGGVVERDVNGEGEGQEPYVEIALTTGVRWVDMEGGREGQQQQQNGERSLASSPGREVVSASAAEVGSEQNGAVGVADVKGSEVRKLERLVFVPYYYRANREASKGVSRVGIRRWYG